MSIRKPKYWLSILGLTLIAIGLFFDWYWVWGVLFTLWALNDIRNRRTYLLEDVPRDNAPMLYWIIVLLWITLAGWSLSFFNWAEVKNDVRSLYVSSYQDLFQTKQKYFGKVQNVDTDESVRAKRQQPVAMSNSFKNSNEFRSKSTNKKKQQAGIDIKNEIAGFRLRIPTGWKYTESTDNTTITAHAESANGYGTASLIAVDSGGFLSRQTFIDYMNSDLLKEFPFMQSGGEKKSVGNSTIDSVTVYRGTYKGDQITVFIGYKTIGRYGYVFIGMYDSRAVQTENLLYQILQTLEVDRR